MPFRNEVFARYDQEHPESAHLIALEDAVGGIPTAVAGAVRTAVARVAELVQPAELRMQPAADILGDEALAV